MRLLQALRRSIKGDKEKQPVNITPKTAVAIVPPKKVGCPSTFHSNTMSRMSDHALIFGTRIALAPFWSVER